MNEVDVSWARGARTKTEKGGLVGTGSIAPVREPGRGPSLLALHGFGATPNEVLMFTDVAAELGLRRVAPLLPGHGTHARDLARTTYADWFTAAAHEFEQIAQHGPVIVGGQSMGAVLALDLASRYPERVAAVAVLATATRLSSPFTDWGLACVSALGADQWFMPKFGGPNMRDASAKQGHITYDLQPVAAAADLRRAGLRVLGQLQLIKCPAFVAHGVHDAVCPVTNAWEIAQRLGTPDVELSILQGSAHILTKDCDRDALRLKLRAFFERQASALKPSAAASRQR
jgi:carboxylesterase